jgi:opacity protein-like surface antigen
MEVRSWVRGKWVVGALLVTMAVSAAKAEEKAWSRAYRGELYPIVQVLGGDEITAYDGLVKLETDTTPVFGAGMGLNLSDHLNINTEFLMGHMDTVQSIPLLPGTEAGMGLNTWLWDVNLDYHILKSRLTPLVTGGVGLMNFHNHDQNRDESHFSYNLGVGARWDITDRIALRVIYRSLWTTKLEDADDPFQFNCVAASLIFMFK